MSYVSNGKGGTVTDGDASGSVDGIGGVEVTGMIRLFFIVPYYYIICFGCFICINMLFYIIFGTNLLT